jgi:hypothetical protein
MCGCEFFPQKSPGAALLDSCVLLGGGFPVMLLSSELRASTQSSILQIKGESVLLPFLLLFPFFSFVSWLG